MKKLLTVVLLALSMLSFNASARNVIDITEATCSISTTTAVSEHIAINDCQVSAFHDDTTFKQASFKEKRTSNVLEMPESTALTGWAKGAGADDNMYTSPTYTQLNQMCIVAVEDYYTGERTLYFTTDWDSQVTAFLISGTGNDRIFERTYAMNCRF